jgi:hypothetical protein
VTVHENVSTPPYADRVDEMELGRKKRAASNGDAGMSKKDLRAAAVKEMNLEYALILVGSGAAILREGHDAYGEPEYKFMSIDAFKEWLRPQKVWTGDTYIGAAALWLNDEHRRQYDGLVFAPQQQARGNYYNLWRGFAVEPDPRGAAGCQRFLSHMADNVCDGDEKHFAWLMGWFAALVQNPTEKTGNAVVFKGPQGAGKTIVGRCMGELLGEHYTLVADPRYVTGRFNSHLINRLLLQLDEATWGGDHVATGKLKDLITGDYQLIEFKGKEPVSVRNYLRLMITSNNDWVVPAGMDERRFAVFDVGEKQMQNHAYFQAIEDEMRNGGAGALLHYLQHYDLSEINLRQIPTTAALFDQKLSSLTPEMSWWIDVLNEGSLPGDKAGEGSAPASQLFDSYIAHAHNRGVNRRGNAKQLGIFLAKHAPGRARKKRGLNLGGAGGPRVWWYDFPPLAKCRAEFCRIARYPVDWDEEDSEWSPDTTHAPP